MRICCVLLVSGCFVTEKQPQPDFACEGVPLPATAPDFVRVQGIVRDLAGNVTLPGVTIQGISGSLNLTPVVSDAQGIFEFSHETPGTPTKDSVHAEAMALGLLSTTASPGIPVAGDQFFEVRMLDLATVMSFADDAGVTLDPNLAFALVRVSDCNESPVAGGKVTTDPVSMPIYFRLGGPDVTATETDASGIVLFANLPTPAMVTISGTIGDVQLRPNVVETRPTEFVQTLARP